MPWVSQVYHLMGLTGAYQGDVMSALKQNDQGNKEPSGASLVLS